MGETVLQRDFPVSAVRAAWTIAAELARGWLWILAGGGIGFLIALAVLNLIPPQHTATTVIGPTSVTGPAAIGVRVPLERQNTTGLAEHPAGSEEVSDFARYLHLLTSPTVARRLLSDTILVRTLFDDRWDPATQTWHLPRDPLSRVVRMILALAGRESWVEPDVGALTRVLGRTLVVESVGTGALRRIRFRHTDPAFARYLLAQVTAATDAQLREEARHRTEMQIAYIRQRLTGLSAADQRRALVDLLDNQERILLLIGVDLPYAADTVEPPVVSALPDWPNVSVLLVAFTAVGLAIGAFAIGSRSGWQQWSRERRGLQ